MEGGRDIPAAGVVADNRRRGQRGVRGEEILVTVGATAVAHEDPAPRHQTPAGLVPVAGRAGDRHAPRAAALPADRQPPEAAPLGHRFPGLGQPAALHPGPALTAVARRRGEQVGIRMEFADQGQPGVMVAGEARHRVRAIAGVADEHEGPPGEAQQEHARQPALVRLCSIYGPPPNMLMCRGRKTGRFSAS